MNSDKLSNPVSLLISLLMMQVGFALVVVWATG
ncbi:hypothetical protein LDDCCGHA_5731 [Methylobacterium oxalidis]|nr:hypothetical protein LDDCCGHA_5731 [Methylobacterium oxalidis]